MLDEEEAQLISSYANMIQLLLRWLVWSGKCARPGMHVLDVINTSTGWLCIMETREFFDHKNGGYNAAQRHQPKDWFIRFQTIFKVPACR